MRLFENETIAISPCKHGLMMYLKNDMFIGRSLDVYGEWYDPEIQLLSQVIKKNNLIIDIGANIGAHTVPFAKLVGSEGMVLAFEPQRLLHGILSANMLLNNLYNVKCYHQAVGRTAGELNIPFLDPNAEQNFGIFNAFGHADGDIVPLIRLDDLRLPRCDLIKIDVEGAEADVLAGGEMLIKHFRPALFVENNHSESAYKVNMEIMRLGYRGYWTFGMIYNRNNFRENEVDIFQSDYVEANLLCIPAEHQIDIAGAEPLLGVGDDHKQAFARFMERIGR